jgi:hypothetical protein
VSNCTARHPYNHATGMNTRSALAVSEFGGFVNDLVEGREDIIGELDLRDWFHALRCRTNGEAHDSLFCQRGIEDTF